MTDLILFADKHHVPKGRIKNLSQPLPQHITEKIKEKNFIRIPNHSDSHILQLSKEITDPILRTCHPQEKHPHTHSFSINSKTHGPQPHIHFRHSGK